MDNRSDKNRKPSMPTRRNSSGATRSEPMSRDELRNKRYLELKRKRRRNRLIAYGAAAVVIVILAVVLSLTVFFKISSFDVKGDEVYAPEDIVAATELSKGGNLFGFDRENVAELVEVKLPYVSDLSIKRSLTGKVTLTVTAAKAVMAIDNGDSYTLLDSSCKVLEAETQTINEDVAVLKASNASALETGRTAEFENPDDVSTLIRLWEIINANGFTKVTQVDITDPTNIRLKYDMRITLKIGSLSSLEGKIEFIKATLAKLDSEEPSFSGTMDFTIDNKAFVNDVDEEKTTEAPPAEPSDEAAEGEQQDTSQSAESNTSENDG